MATARALVFTSLVPDPDNPRCPDAFQTAVEQNLKTRVPTELQYYRRGRETHQDEDPYRPYEGVSETLRNLLLMFIAIWSPESLAFEAGKRSKASAASNLVFMATAYPTRSPMAEPRTDSPLELASCRSRSRFQSRYAPVQRTGAMTTTLAGQARITATEVVLAWIE